MSAIYYRKNNKANKKWYHDKQALALVTGAISTIITALNFFQTLFRS